MESWPIPIPDAFLPLFQTKDKYLNTESFVAKSELLVLLEIDIIEVVGHRFSENKTFLFFTLFSRTSPHNIAVRKVVVCWLIESEVLYLPFAVFIGGVFGLGNIVLVVFIALLFPFVDFEWGSFPAFSYPFHKINLCLYFIPGLFLFNQSLFFAGNGLKFNQFGSHFLWLKFLLLHFLSSFL